MTSHKYLWRILAFNAAEYHDGDTFWLLIDRGFRDASWRQCRLLDVDTYELRKDVSDPVLAEQRKALGREAKRLAASWLTNALRTGEVIGQTHRDKKDHTFGRPLIALYCVDCETGKAEYLADFLRDVGMEKQDA